MAGMTSKSTNLNLKLVALMPMGRRLWSPRTYLRRFSVSDAESWFYLLERNRKWLKPWSPPFAKGMKVADIRKIVKQGHADARGCKRLDTGIFRRSDDMLIGKMALHNIIWGILRSAGFGFYLDEKFAGQGFMREALATMVSFAFEEGRFHRLWGGVQTKNVNSLNVFKKLGFTCDGIHREELFIDGQWRDQYFFTMLETEYGSLADGWIKQRWLGE